MRVRLGARECSTGEAARLRPRPRPRQRPALLPSSPKTLSSVPAAEPPVYQERFLANSFKNNIHNSFCVSCGFAGFRHLSVHLQRLLLQPHLRLMPLPFFAYYFSCYFIYTRCHSTAEIMKLFFVVLIINCTTYIIPVTSG